MKAIILAAGRGKRMKTLTKNMPKSLLPLNNKPLIEWQMEAIKQAGITEIAIVKGYLGDMYEYPVTYFENSIWHETNMFYTLLCADTWLSYDECVVSYSDIVYLSEAVKSLILTSEEISITYDPNWKKLWEKRFSDPLSDAEVFKYKEKFLQDIGGRAKCFDEIQGQYMGLLKFTPKGWKMVKKIIKHIPERIYHLDMTSLLKLLLCVGISIEVAKISSPWCEIDNENDYHLCQAIMADS